MARTVQIRDLDDHVYAALARQAGAIGVSVPELLRRHATRLAARPSLEEWVDRTRRQADGPTAEVILDTLDELRGSWPDAGR